MAEPRRRRLLQKLQSGSKNIRFAEAVAYAGAVGFRLARIPGCHHIYVRASVPELLNLQNVRGLGKQYQIEHHLQLIERYNLAMEDET